MSGPPLPITNVDPFAIDPLVLGRLNRWNVPVATFAAVALTVTAVLSTYVALLSGYYASEQQEASFWGVLWSFVRHRPLADVSAIPFLVDVPSITLSIVIPLSITTVYALFRHVARMHADLHAYGCIDFTGQPNAFNDFNAQITQLNARFVQFGRFRFLAIFLSVVLAGLMNLRQSGHLYQFLGPGDLSSAWWASLTPLHPGGLVWTLVGGLGLYAFYAEAVLGLSYLTFLKKFGSLYAFRGNPANPDGYYGWRRLRSVITNLEIGLVLTALAAWAISFLFVGGFGVWSTAALLAVFVGIVTYVFVGVTANFRRQATADRTRQIVALEAVIAAPTASVPELLAVNNAYQRLRLVSALPSTPIRRSWLVIGLATAGVPIVTLVIQMLQYLLDLRK